MAMSRRLEPGTTFIIEDYADESTYKQAVLEDDGKYEVYEQYEFYVPYYRIPNDDEVNPLTGILKNATLNDANCPIISEAFNAPNDNANVNVDDSNTHIDDDKLNYLDDHKDWKGPIISEIEEPGDLNKQKDSGMTKIINNAHVRKKQMPIPQTSNIHFQQNYSNPIPANVPKMLKLTSPTVAAVPNAYNYRFCLRPGQTDKRLMLDQTYPMPCYSHNPMLPSAAHILDIPPDYDRIPQFNLPRYEVNKDLHSLISAFHNYRKLPEHHSFHSPIVNAHGHDVLSMITRYNELIDQMISVPTQHQKQRDSVDRSKLLHPRVNNPFNRMKNMTEIKPLFRTERFVNLDKHVDVLTKLNNAYNIAAAAHTNNPQQYFYKNLFRHQARFVPERWIDGNNGVPGYRISTVNNSFYFNADGNVDTLSISRL